MLTSWDLKNEGILQSEDIEGMVLTSLKSYGLVLGLMSDLDLGSNKGVGFLMH